MEAMQPDKNIMPPMSLQIGRWLLDKLTAFGNLPKEPLAPFGDTLPNDLRTDIRDEANV